jgi:hypothetical protein
MTFVKYKIITTTAIAIRNALSMVPIFFFITFGFNDCYSYLV